MIKSKQDYEYYLECDRKAINTKRTKPRMYSDSIWKWTRLLRKLEYIKNCKKGLIGKISYNYYRLKFNKASKKLGFSIGINVFGPGLAIFHYGTIIVNSSARIGKNCRLYNGVNIARGVVVGDNCYIAPGVKILADVSLSDNLQIGANAVVSKSFEEPNMTIAGVPAKKISDKGSRHVTD